VLGVRASLPNERTAVVEERYCGQYEGALYDLFYKESMGHRKTTLVANRDLSYKSSQRASKTEIKQKITCKDAHAYAQTGSKY